MSTTRPAHIVFLMQALLIAAIAFTPSSARACSCMWGGGFLAVAPNAETVVRARVIDYHGRNRKVDLAMDVEVVEVLKGGALPAKTIRIWGDNGALCRPYVSSFPRGTEWVFAIRPLRGSRELEAERANDFYIPGCGAYWLRVIDERVRGHIRGGAPGTPEHEEALVDLRRVLGAR
jgi:hypothetical protein